MFQLFFSGGEGRFGPVRSSSGQKGLPRGRQVLQLPAASLVCEAAEERTALLSQLLRRPLGAFLSSHQQKDHRPQSPNRLQKLSHRCCQVSKVRVQDMRERGSLHC